jgi:tRNA(Arg) A34 adenosine deaminase TadA
MANTMISDKDKYMMVRAAELARFGEHRVRVGCVITSHGKIIVGAFNTRRNLTNIEYEVYGRTTHAEIAAAKQIEFDPSRNARGYRIYVARVGAFRCARSRFAS